MKTLKFISVLLSVLLLCSCVAQSEKNNNSDADALKSQVEGDIKLTLSEPVLNRFGKTSSSAEAIVSGDVLDITYSMDENLFAEIDPSTGNIKLKSKPKDNAEIKMWLNIWKTGTTVNVSAALPSGKSDTAVLTIEPDLYLEVDDYSLPSNNTVTISESSFTIRTTNEVKVDWSAKTTQPDGWTCTYDGVQRAKDSYFIGFFKCTHSEGGPDKKVETCYEVSVTAQSAGGQTCRVKIKKPYVDKDKINFKPISHPY